MRMTLFAALVVTAAVAASDEKTYARPSLLVDAKSLLAARPGAFLVLDSRSEKAYAAGHAPGAVHVNADAWGKAVVADEKPEVISARLGAKGIDGKTPVVVIGDTGKPDGPRLWWMLRRWGVADVRVLNGGHGAFVGAGGKVTTEVPAVKTLTPTLKADAARLALKGDLLRELAGGKPGQIIDARSKAEHCGEKKMSERGGAIPGAKHLDWSDTLEKDGTFKPAPKLAKLFADTGIDPTKPTTTYCQGGGRAAVMAFVVELMGGPPARNYYRSWGEWGNDKATPVEVPGKK